MNVPDEDGADIVLPLPYAIGLPRKARLATDLARAKAGRQADPQQAIERRSSCIEHPALIVDQWARTVIVRKKRDRLP
jgi:hypothetical protein